MNSLDLHPASRICRRRGRPRSPGTAATGRLPWLVTALILFLAAPAWAANVSLLVIDLNSYMAQQAVSRLALPQHIRVRAFTHQDLLSDPAARDFVASSRVVIVDVMMRELTRYVLEHRSPANKDVYALRGSGNDEDLQKQGFIFHPQLREYFGHLSAANLQNLLRLAVHLSIDRAVSYEPVVQQPNLGIYHPEAPAVFSNYADYRRWYEGRPGYRADAPRLGLMFFSTSLIKGQVEFINHIMAELEKAGFTVLPCFGRDEDVLGRFFLDERRQARVDVVLSFSLKFSSALNDRVKTALTGLNVPVINAINLLGIDIDHWRADPVGIPPLAVAHNIAVPETSGVIEPTPLSGRVEASDPEIPGRFYLFRSIADNLDHLIPRLQRWITLQRKPNAEKKVAVLYYHHSQGKQNIGASYLNVFRSLEHILARLRQEGYRVPAAQRLTEEGIKQMILTTGLNIGSWAPGEFDRLLAAGSVVRVPMAEYKQWFSQLPSAFREGVVKQWGPPEAAEIMVKDGRFIIPAVTVGNLVLLPEPARGWSDSPLKLYHDVTVFPHHQYIAAYLWLARGFRADAMIHLGTHATHEWLPGKQVGLSSSCPPEVLITDIPNIYPYIVDDVGEGLQAKRRGRGVIIDHLTPPLQSAGLYKEYDDLQTLIENYEKGRSLGSQTTAVYLEQIRDLVRRTGLAKDLRLPELNDEALQQIQLYLHEIKDDLLPYGMHTFGRSPAGAALEDTVKAIVDKNPEARSQDVREALTVSGPREMDHLVKALNGGYVPPGEGNDPLRNLAALPTGNNFYGFSPDKVPTAAAWQLGKQAADDIIARSLKEHQRYPEKVAIVLWAVETLRNEGVNECTALYLMGMAPVWDKNGRVTGTRVIPARELQRPRIDIVLNPSGLYRDLYPDKLLFLDRAVQQAAAQTDIDNYLSRNNRRLQEQLQQSGLSPQQADKLSRLRIFTTAPGTYGNRVSELAGASGFWKSDAEIADVYQQHTGFAYGADHWGVPAPQLFKENLKRVDTVLHSRSSNVYGVLDNDDMFSYLGGLALAVRQESGKNPDTMLTMQLQPHKLRVEDLAKTIGQEMRARYLNPKWITGMKADNYAGAREMSHFVEYLWGWQVTVPSAVDGSRWDQVYEVYVEDKYGQDLKEFFNRVNPWAYQSITARMLEASRKGYWQADDQVIQKLAAEYALNVVEKGVACCDHTCNNPVLNQMVVNIVSLPGVLSPRIVEQFKIAVDKAAGRRLEEQVQDRTRVQDALSAGFSQKDAVPQPHDPARPAAQSDSPAPGPEARMVEGFKMETVPKEDDRTEVSASGVQWFASLFILLLIGLFAFGTRMHGENRFL